MSIENKNDNNKQNNLRHGFTTGSCAAAAAKAAVYMLLTGTKLEAIKITTPKGIDYVPNLLEIAMSGDRVKCGIQKDGGDDPDATTGLIIFAQAELRDKPGISISGGEGIGVVTKPGLDQPIGEYAINSIPREMIEREVTEVMDLLGWEGGANIRISAPGGEEVAKKTFNPRLGIEGGISIIGTSGIVEPMSQDAIIETIKVELNQKRAQGLDGISISPGNYGVDFMKTLYDFDLNQSVKCSNYIGLACDHIRALGFSKVLLVGHAGKLVKVAGGIMNTHSKEADSRMEIIAASSIREGVAINDIIRILDANTTEDAFNILKDAGQLEQVSHRLVEKIQYYLSKRLVDDIQVECMMFTNELGILSKTHGAEDLIEELKRGRI